MHRVPFGSGIRVAIVLLTLGVGRSYAGFTDMAQANDLPPVNEDLLAGIHEPEAQAFDFNVTSRSSEELMAAVQPSPRSAPQTVAAPLPVALLPGGVLLAGSFLATRVFKRRIV